jgi:hypothetical protein
LVWCDDHGRFLEGQRNQWYLYSSTTVNERHRVLACLRHLWKTGLENGVRQLRPRRRERGCSSRGSCCYRKRCSNTTNYRSSERSARPFEPKLETGDEPHIRSNNYKVITIHVRTEDGDPS